MSIPTMARARLLRWPAARLSRSEVFRYGRSHHQIRAASTAVDVHELQNRVLPVLTEKLGTLQNELLQFTIRDFLPHPNQATSDARNILAPGYHLVYFRNKVPTMKLLDDGTDIIHAPDASWKYRVWAGGSMTFPTPHEVKLDGSVASLVERINNVRLIGPEENPDKVFVTIGRDAFLLPPHFRDEMSVNAHALQQVNAYASKPSQGPPRLPAILSEERTLCFTRNPPASLSSSAERRVISPPENPYYTVSILPTPQLLFRFSALTFNAHAIHLDPEYTKREYGLPNLLVHGPLTLILMLEVLGQALEKYSLDKGLPRFVIREINYKNLAPLFVNETMTVCCKRTGSKKSTKSEGIDSSWSSEAEDWQVWIERKQGSNVTMAVRANVEVRPQ